MYVWVVWCGFHGFHTKEGPKAATSSSSSKRFWNSSGSLGLGKDRSAKLCESFLLCNYSSLKLRDAEFQESKRNSRNSLSLRSRDTSDTSSKGKKKQLMCPFHVALPHLHCKAPRAHSHRITEDAASSLLTCSHGPHTPEPSCSGAGRRRRSRSSGEARLFKQG
jgi:hypothetical protein